MESKAGFFRGSCGMIVVFFLPCKFRFEPFNSGPFVGREMGWVGWAWSPEAVCYWWRSSGQVIRGRVDDEFTAKGDSLHKFSVVLFDGESPENSPSFNSLLGWCNILFYPDVLYHLGTTSKSSFPSLPMRSESGTAKPNLQSTYFTVHIPTLYVSLVVQV